VIVVFIVPVRSIQRYTPVIFFCKSGFSSLFIRMELDGEHIPDIQNFQQKGQPGAVGGNRFSA
jgi:hypothetical protein